eukprot:GEMP01031483.1.p1 GENE.GEMP01031483.1~~GEMP01031483.1.p1  ORF type:complete len:255 (+),score=35.39 GEMP01031483.1:90-854(+)
MSGRLLLDVLILGSDVSLTCSLVSVLNQLKTTKTARSMSLLTLSAIVLSRCVHGLSHLFGLHFDSSELPMLTYLLTDVINAVLGIYIVYFFMKYFRTTYEQENDDFGAMLLRLWGKDSIPARWILFYGSTVVTALLWQYVRRSNHSSMVTAFFCSYNEVIGAFALLPQLWMFHRDKVVSECLGNFIVYTALHRVCTLLFWASFPIVYRHTYLDNRIVQMSSEVLNILILSDFMYYYIRAKMRGEKNISIGDSVV